MCRPPNKGKAQCSSSVPFLRTAQKSHLGDVPGVAHAADGNVVVVGAGGVARVGQEVQGAGAAVVVGGGGAAGVGALAVDERRALRGGSVRLGGVHGCGVVKLSR